MTREEYIKNCIKNADLKDNSTESLIALAYFIGRESCAKTLIAKFYDKVKNMREKAEKSAFRHFANEIIGSSEENFIYSLDYSQTKTKKYGKLEYEKDDF